MVNQLPGDQQQVGVNEIRNKINELILSGATVDVSQFPPSNPGEGDLWFDTTLAEIYIYLGSPTNAWVQASNTSNTSSVNGENFCVVSFARAAAFNISNNTWYFTDKATTGADYIGNVNNSQILNLEGSNGNFCVASFGRAAVFKSSNNTWYFTEKATTGADYIGNSNPGDMLGIEGINGDFCVTSFGRAAVFKSSTNTWYFTDKATAGADYIGNGSTAVLLGIDKGIDPPGVD